MDELNKGITDLFEPENDEGNIEYKQHLIVNLTKFMKLKEDMLLS